MKTYFKKFGTIVLATLILIGNVPSNVFSPKVCAESENLSISNEVVLDIANGGLVIYPTYYTQNAGLPVMCDASTTTYIITGTRNDGNRHLIFRNESNTAKDVTFNVILDNLTLHTLPWASAIIFGGDGPYGTKENTTINLKLKGINSIIGYGYNCGFFGDATLYISAEKNSNSTIDNVYFADHAIGPEIHLYKVGKYKITVGGLETDNVDDAKINKPLVIMGYDKLQGNPIISGETIVGSILTVNHGITSPNPVNIQCLWYRDGTQIGSGGTYQIQFDDIGKTLTAKIFADNYIENIETSVDIINIENQHKIIYKNYDGSDIAELDPSMPTIYTEGTGFVLPTTMPNDNMKGYTFLGYWDCPLDQNKKIAVTGPGYEDEQTLDLNIGNKITEIFDTDNEDITLYTRYTSNMLDEDINGRENYIFGVPGIFPNGSTAAMKVLHPGEKNYEDTLKEVDENDIDKVKIVEFTVFNEEGEIVQPKSFFGDAIVGFKIPDGFNADEITLIRVAANDQDITLRSKIWVDPYASSLRYIEGYTDHFSPYAIFSPWSDNFPATGNQTQLWIISISAVLIVSAGVLVWTYKKRGRIIK